MSNIIFLDVDGVLNSINNLIEVYNKTKKPHSGYDYPFDENCLKNLQELVNETNSKLVITSTWRKEQKGRETLLNELKEYGLDKQVIGYTPVLPNGNREAEIKKYLSTLQEKPNYIILDDSKEFVELSHALIKTDTRTGLTNKNVEQAIKILNKKDIDIER